MKKGVIISIIVLVCSCQGENDENLRVACAANLELGMDSIIEVFEENNSIDCELIVGASGILSSQIETGAPFDIFISADKSYPQNLYDKKLTSKPVHLKSSKMVMVNLTNLNYTEIDSFLIDQRVSKIGMADPEVAPFGRAAKEFLEKNSLWNQVKNKIVYAESVAQLNHFISSKAVDVAFSSEAFISQSETKYDFYKLSKTDYTPIEQYYVQVMRTGRVSYSSGVFAEFLQSDTSSKILEYFGY
jgi:molybdate transport system substrate-binding protein